MAAFGRNAAEGLLGGRAPDQDVEAGEGGGLMLDIEALPARELTVGAEDPELAECALERAAADALGAEARVANQEQIGVQAEDVVDTPAEPIHQIQQGADGAHQRLHSA